MRKFINYFALLMVMAVGLISTYIYAHNQGFAAGNRKIEFEPERNLIIIGARKSGLEFFNPYGEETINQRIERMNCEGILIVPPGYEFTQPHETLRVENCDGALIQGLTWSGQSGQMQSVIDTRNVTNTQITGNKFDFRDKPIIVETK